MTTEGDVDEDRQRERQAPADVAGKGPPHPVVQLAVLPHSGKVDELRRQMQADQETQLGAESPSSSPEAPGAGAAAATSPAASIQQKLLQGKVIEVIRQIYDPEIPVNIYDLGLIYDVDVREDNSVKVKMTLTAPACPVAGTLPGEVEKRIENIPEVKSADVELVWDPPWSRDRMSEVAQLQLGMF